MFAKQYKDKGVNVSYYTLRIMDIIRAFTTNSLHTEIVIKGTVENPLFRASDVALILEISNIRASIKDFNETEKVVQTMTTPGGPQNVLFLTRTGLFRLLFRSKNPIALQVQYWACDVVKELQINQRKKNDMMKLQESLECEKMELNNPCCANMSCITQKYMTKNRERCGNSSRWKNIPNCKSRGCQANRAKHQRLKNLNRRI